MFNPFVVFWESVKHYGHNIKHAPTDQYTTVTVAEMVMPNTSSEPMFVGSPPEVPKSRPDGTGTTRDASKPSKGERKGHRHRHNVLDVVVMAAGSRWMFALANMLLVLWAIMGGVLGPTDTWQVVLQDTQSIQSYISDTLLMRQQQNMTRSLLHTICGMISRQQSNQRMLQKLTDEQRVQLKRSMRPLREDLPSAVEVPESWFDKVVNTLAAGLGSIWAVLIFWSGIIAWVLCGIPLHFSDTWQLYVNTATALVLTFTTMFLQNVRRQHEMFLQRCLVSIRIVDCEIEADLRRLTGDREPNPAIASEPPAMGRIERTFDHWAYIVGSGGGVCLSACVFAVWIIVGEPMHFSDNWFLIIGTYTGLMGFVDGFVLRNVYHRETVLADHYFQILRDLDFQVAGMLDVPAPDDDAHAAYLRCRWPLPMRMSAYVSHLCELPRTTLGSVVVVLALIAVASGMKWTETGQLICNTPTMIIEAFLIMMLIQAHNMADYRRRGHYTDILQRRLALERRTGAGRDDSEEKREDEETASKDAKKGGMGMITITKLLKH